jgi:hypothetical protein
VGGGIKSCCPLPLAGEGRVREKEKALCCNLILFYLNLKNFSKFTIIITNKTRRVKL